MNAKKNKGIRQEMLLYKWRVPHHRNQWGISFHFVIAVSLTLKLCHTGELSEAQTDRRYYDYPSPVSLSLLLSPSHSLSYVSTQNPADALQEYKTTRTLNMSSCKAPAVLLFMTETSCSYCIQFHLLPSHKSVTTDWDSHRHILIIFNMKTTVCL